VEEVFIDTDIMINVNYTALYAIVNGDIKNVSVGYGINKLTFSKYPNWKRQGKILI
jgi:hypothetical protein